jgi:hypothetical protein
MEKTLSQKYTALLIFMIFNKNDGRVPSSRSHDIVLKDITVTVKDQ